MGICLAKMSCFLCEIISSCLDFPLWCSCYQTPLPKSSWKWKRILECYFVAATGLNKYLIKISNLHLIKAMNHGIYIRHGYLSDSTTQWEVVLWILELVCAINCDLWPLLRVLFFNHLPFSFMYNICVQIRCSCVGSTSQSAVHNRDILHASLKHQATRKRFVQRPVCVFLRGRLQPEFSFSFCCWLVSGVSRGTEPGFRVWQPCIPVWRTFEKGEGNNSESQEHSFSVKILIQFLNLENL